MGMGMGMGMLSQNGLAVATSILAVIVGWKLFRARRKPCPTAELVLKMEGDTLTGKRVMITGACSGLGLELVRCILNHGKVKGLVVHGRSRERVQGIINSLPQSQRVMCNPAVADFASLTQVHALTRELNVSPPDVIVCCAGVATLPSRTTTVDGYEMQFGINHLAHFALISGLSFHVQPRVVLVSSDVHHGTNCLDMDNLNSDVSYSWFGAYKASK